MDSVSHLRTILLGSLGPRGSQHGDQKLFDELMAHKTRLLNLFDVGSRNSQEQREIEAGKIFVDGKPIAVNSDFARQVIFLSQQLDCSERYIAGLLHTIMTENPNIGPVNCLEVTIASFHQRRRHLVDSLRYIVEAAEASLCSDAALVYTRIDAFVREELISALQVAGGEVSLAYRIFREIESLGNVISRVHVAKQNANSDSLNQGGNTSMGFDILNARYESLKYERRTLATILCVIARLGYLSPHEIQKMVDWLATNPNHAMTSYILTTVLVAFDSVDPQSVGGRIRQKLVMDQGILSFMTKKLDSSVEWKESGLRATVLLKWTLFLTEARHHDPTLEHRDGFKTEELAIQIWNAVQGDAFTYLALAVLRLQTRRDSSPASSFLHSIALYLEQEQTRDSLPDDFKPVMLKAFETLVRSLITHASSELRKIKQRQEDLVLASARSDRTRVFRSSTPSTHPRFSSSSASETDRINPASPRNDIATLYSFIGILYSALPDERALQFWGSGPQVESQCMTYLEYVEATAGKLPAFLQWAIWSSQVRDVDMLMALYDMLAGLAKGQQCSELAYNFVARGAGEVIPGSTLPSSNSTHFNSGPTVSWGVIFGLLESWASPPNMRGQPSAGGSSESWQSPMLASSHHQQQTPALGPKDVLLAQSFLRLLSIVVTHSTPVRIAISGHAQFRAIPTLVALIPLGIPLELKGALFETLGAFCEPGAGVAGVEICKAIWTLMEKLEVINVRAGSDGAFGAGSSLLPSAKGVEVELEEVEAIYKMYPATIPFLKLLSTLIHTPKHLQLKGRLTDAEPINTIPDTLGQPHRLPGIGPFVSFVVDNVFLKIPSREYLRPSDRWHMNDLCLCFIERSLASYDLESLVRSTEDLHLKKDSILPLLIHPGYDIMKRMLTNSPLQAGILSYIVSGVEGFEKELAGEEPFFRTTMIRVLRIVHRVLELQDIFIDVLVPLLVEFDSAPIIGTIYPRSYFTKFDQALSFGPQYAPAVAAYLAYPAHAELVLLSVKILTILSASNFFSNLTTLIERSNDSERILNGLTQIMNSESTTNVVVAETVAEQCTGAGAKDIDSTSDVLEQSIRLTVLELFVQNTEPGKPYPNVAHFLLFGRTDGEQLIQDPHALGSRQSCIHVILDLLNAGVPESKSKRKGPDQHPVPHQNPLFVTIPGLAERCYRVIYQLCIHPRTSEFTMRYLRTREDFFARQLAIIPSKVPETIEAPYIQVLYDDGSRVTTTVSALCSFLRLRSWIFDLVALDLHVLTSKGHYKGVTELLGILFGNADLNQDESAIWENGVLQPFRDFGQSHLRIVEFLQSLDFDWSDSLSVKPTELNLLQHLNLRSCLRTNAFNCEVVDRTALLSLLATARRTLRSQGNIITPTDVEKLNAEATYILESCAVENHRRDVRHATATSYNAWRRLLDMTLTKCFTRLPHDRRENMLFDLLHVLPGIIRSTNISESTAVLLAETVLSLITKLREDRQHQVIIQSAGGDAEAGSLPAERLHALLGSILGCILENNRVDLVRGNLYAVLINYLHLVSKGGYELPYSKMDKRHTSLSSTDHENLTLDDSQSLVPANQFDQSTQSLETSSLSLLKSGMERFITTISRDAIDGTEVWKTIAFMLLDSLVRLSRLEKQHVVLSALVRHGILPNFSRGVKESDIRLQSVLKPDPEDLNPLYVYEAKMSLFIRIAQTRVGAERLLEVQLLPVLAQCDYLDSRPEADQSFIDQDTFLPSAIQRYHQLFMPAVQLVHAILAALGPRHATAANQALDFLSSHKDTIVILLKSDPDYIPLSSVEELHLLVSLCASVLPLVPTSDLLTTNSGFGGIHSAILTLAARFLGDATWIQNIKPQNHTEMVEASVYASGYGTESKFDIRVRRKARQLRQAIIIYIGTASEFTASEPEIIAILSPVIAISHQERGSRFSATIPTIGDAVEALNDLCYDLAETLKQISDLSGELASKDHSRVDNIQEILDPSRIHVLQELDISQKQLAICRELELIRRTAKDTAKTLLNSTEMLLLLLWRHLLYYSEGSHSHNLQQRSHAMRFLPDPNPEDFRSDVGKKLGPALQRLAFLDLDFETLGDDWRTNHAYLEIMCRRLRDTAGLHNSSESTSPEGM